MAARGIRTLKNFNVYTDKVKNLDQRKKYRVLIKGTNDVVTMRPLEYYNYLKEFSEDKQPEPSKYGKYLKGVWNEETGDPHIHFNEESRIIDAELKLFDFVQDNFTNLSWKEKLKNWENYAEELRIRRVKL